MTAQNDIEILLVEDDIAHVELIRCSLDSAAKPYILQVAYSLTGARELLRNLSPDIAIVDMNLPDGQGIELLDSDAIHNHIPAVIMTSFGREQDAVRAIKSGAVDYIVKSDVAFLDIAHIVDRSLREWQNLTWRKAAEESQRMSEKKYRDLSREFQVILHGIPETLMLVDKDLQVIWHNSKDFINAEKDLRVAEKDKAQTCFSLLCKTHHPCSQCPALECFMTGKMVEVTIEANAERTMNIKAFPLKNEEGDVDRAIILANDITEKQRYRAETIRAGQLASLGELAAGVAHEINNPINGIINYAQLIADSEESRTEARQLSEEIIEEGRRVAHIVRNLLSFARGPLGEKQKLKISEVLSASLALTDSQLSRDGIMVSLKIDTKLPEVSVNKRQLQQVILNLISNSRYALNEKYLGDHPQKRIDITAEQAIEDEKSWLRLTIADYGTGIPENVLNKIMNPFFSTKPRDKGTGLGMSISYGIIKDHDGKISVNSTFGEGTSVILDLPLSISKDDI